MCPNFWSRILANFELDNRHSAQHSMSSSTIDIRLNIKCLARQSTFSSTFELAMRPNFWSRILANVELDNRHSAQHSMSSSTIDIRLNIECLARQSTFSSTFELTMRPNFWSRILANVELDNQHSAQHSMSSWTIDIRLNIECLARQSTFSSTFELAMRPNFWSRILANVELDNRHLAQHSMSSSTIDIRLNIECLARQSTIQLNIRDSNQSELLRPNLGECWARQSKFSSTFNV